MKERFDDLGKEFQELEIEQLKKGEIEARQKLESANATVSETRAEFERQLNRAGKVSNEAWNDVQETLRSAWTDMKEAVDHARKDFAGEIDPEDASTD